MKVKTVLTVTILYDTDELDVLDETINWGVDKLTQKISSLMSDGEDHLIITDFDYNNLTEEVK